MKLTLTLELGNDAMQSGYDVAATVVEAARGVARGIGDAPYVVDGPYPVRDANGNTVGAWSVTK